MVLTGKKKLFAAAKLDGMSNKDAALAAGCSAATASQAGSRLAKDPDVVAYLAKATAKPPKKRTPAAAPPAARPTGSPPVLAATDGPKFDLAAAMQHTDPKAFLTAAMNDIELDPKQRIIAAKALLPIFYGKVADQGKKDGKDAAAKKVAAGGGFAATPPPLKLVGRK